MVCLCSLFQIAVPDVVEAAKDADIYILVLPHQFLRRVCELLKGTVKKDAVGISLIKVISILDFVSMYLLALKVLITTTADNTSVFFLFFVFFSDKIRPDISCESSVQQNDDSHEMSSYFLWKK